MPKLPFMKKIRRLSAMLLLLVIMSSCKTAKPISSIGSKPVNLNEPVCGANSSGLTYSICEYGIFYQKPDGGMSGGTLNYYDLTAKEEFVLCDKPNCAHSDASCSAWYEDMDGATGLALYGENIYVIKLNKEANTYDFISMDISGNNQKTIYSLDIGEYVPGTWIASGIGYVYYAGGKAWLSVDYSYIEGSSDGSMGSGDYQSSVFMGIDLDDSSVTALNELPQKPVLSESKENPLLQYEAISKDYIVIGKVWYDTERLSEKTFFSAFESGEFEQFKDSKDPYYDYQVWHYDNSRNLFSYDLYNINSGERTEFKSGEKESVYEENGHVSYFKTQYGFNGFYDNHLIYTEYKQDGSLIFRYDLNSKKSEQILEIKSGGLLIATHSGDVITSIINGDKLLYCEYTDDEKADIYVYDLKTSESAKLFQDKRNITFRMTGETKDKFIGTIYTPTTSNVYMINKDEYYKGNPDAAERLF